MRLLLLLSILLLLGACGGGSALPPALGLPVDLAWERDLPGHGDRLLAGRTALSVTDLQAAITWEGAWEKSGPWRELGPGRWLLVLQGRPGGPAAAVDHLSIVIQDMGDYRAVSLLVRYRQGS